MPFLWDFSCCVHITVCFTFLSWNLCLFSVSVQTSLRCNIFLFSYCDLSFLELALDITWEIFQSFMPLIKFMMPRIVCNIFLFPFWGILCCFSFHLFHFHSPSHLQSSFLLHIRILFPAWLVQTLLLWLHCVSLYISAIFLLFSDRNIPFLYDSWRFYTPLWLFPGSFCSYKIFWVYQFTWSDFVNP